MNRILNIFLILAFTNLAVGQDLLILQGTVKDKISGRPIAGAHISLVSSRVVVPSDKNGTYFLNVKPDADLTIKVSHIGYGELVRSLPDWNGADTIHLDFELTMEPQIIRPVEITARSAPVTIYGSFQYCVADFEFYNDKFLLLTYASKDPKSCSLMLRDKKGKLLLSANVKGDATELYKDYEDRYYVICEEQVFRINIEAALLLLVPMTTAYFEKNIKPGIDIVGDKILFTDYRWNHPQFSYYTVWKGDEIVEELKTVMDKPLMRMYRFEYYYLNNQQRVAAWKLADKYDGFDRHDAAAFMTGFQNSLYYEPLYAPMFVVNDTILIFDHYANKLYKYNQFNQVVDSVGIGYHRSNGTMKWKKELVKDVGNDDIYAVFQKNGYYYLNHINTEKGELEGAFKMSDKYTEKMKIKDDFVYYVYDPQDKYQTPFLYKERIQL